MRMALRAVVLGSMLGLALAADPVTAADLTVRQVSETLFRADRDHPADFSGRSLAFLDFGNLDFKGARLVRSDLYGVDLTDARLAGSDLTGAMLDRATLRRADFSNANLSGASLRTVSVSAQLPPNRADAPRFAHANLSDARIEGRLDGTDFSGATLTRAVIGYQTAIWGSYKPRSVMLGCNFANASLAGAQFHKAVLQFSRFTNADLSNADLAGTDLSGVDFTGANLSGADLTNADLDGAALRDVRGLDSVKGLGQARNLGAAIR